MRDDFGVNVALKHQAKKHLNRYILLLNELNAGWVRLRLDFYAYVHGGFDFQAHDYFIKHLRKKKINILGSLEGAVPGTVVNLFGPAWNGFFNPLDKFKVYRQYVIDLTRRYQGEILYWQIWNEPNTKRMWIKNPSASEYALLVKKTFPLIKRVNPGNLIVLGPINSFSLLTRRSFQEYFLELLNEGVERWVDVYAFHPYSLGSYFSLYRSKAFQVERLTEKIKAFLEIYRRRGLKKPIWITEMGIVDRWVRLSSGQIGEVYTQMHDFSLKKGIEKVFIWNLLDFDDPCYSRPNPERFFGLVGSDLRPKESFKVLKKFFKD